MLSCLLPRFDQETSADSTAKESLENNIMPAKFALKCK